MRSRSESAMGVWSTWYSTTVVEDHVKIGVKNTFTIKIKNVPVLSKQPGLYLVQTSTSVCVVNKKHVLGARRLADKAALDHAFMMRAYRV